MIAGFLKSIWMGWFFLSFILFVSTAGAADSENWRVWINIPQRQLHLYLNNELYQSFPVAVGKPSTPSPVGDFRIVSKVINPTWSPEGKPPVPPGPKNPLGKYWLGLNIRGYGIHGNNASWSIGNPVSKGCFRMNNQDIQRIFRLIPRGTPVKITYSPFIGRVDPDQRAWLEIYKDIYKRVEWDADVQRILSDLKWFYQPHLYGLLQLIEANQEGVFEIPRMINLNGDLSGNDAFFWDNRIYLAKTHFDLDNEAGIASGNEKFSDYIELETLQRIWGEGIRYRWNSDFSILCLYRMKLWVNGAEVKRAIRFIEGQPYLHVRKVSEITGTPVDYDFLKQQAETGEVKIFRESNDDIWLDLNDCPRIFAEYNFVSDKERMIIELTVKNLN